MPCVAGLHEKSRTPCPFADSGFPIGPMGTCCSFRGKVTADNLEAFEEFSLRDRLYEDADPKTALKIASDLRETADRLERDCAHLDEKPRGHSSGGMIEMTTGTFTPWPQPSFEEAIRSFRQAADWYEAVARLGFGVFAWS